MRYHLTPVRMAIYQRQEVTSVGDDVAKREPLSLLVGVEERMQGPQEMKDRMMHHTLVENLVLNRLQTSCFWVGPRMRQSSSLATIY